MQNTFFDLNSTRTIHAAFNNNYIKGEVHPNRVMPQHDFVYITEGVWQIIQEGETYTVEKDDVIILTANAHHGGNTPCSDGTKTMYIHASSHPGEFLRSGKKDKCANGVPLEAVIHCGSFPKIKEQFERIIETYSLDAPYKSFRLNSLFSSLIISLYDAVTAQEKRTDTDFLKKVTHCFQNDPHLFYSNKELASMFFISEKAFIERFKEQTKTTPHKFQLQYKLKNIKAMLLSHPEMKLHELAVNFGFYDEFHLSRAFKNTFGLSPTEYRKRNDP